MTWTWLTVLTITLAAHGSGSKAYSIKERELEDPYLVPLAVEREVRDRLPTVFAPEERAIEYQRDRLKIDTDGDGRAETTLSPKKPEVVELEFESGNRHVLFYVKDGRWMASPATLWTVKIGKDLLELLDADLDGRHDGEEDWLRWRGGSFLRQEAGGLLPTDEGLARFELDLDARKPKLVLEEVPRPEWANDLQWAALLTANERRNAGGLGPWTLDPERSAACQQHAEYLYQNNYDYSLPWDGVGSHTEVEGKPGFTREGLEAAESSATSGTDDPARAIAGQFQTMLHRTAFLGTARARFAVGSVAKSKNSSCKGYSVLWGSRLDVSSPREIVVHPAPGQMLTDLAVKRERPRVERDPSFYDRPRGYPISVSFGALPLKDVQLTLFEEDSDEPLEGDVFSPEDPIHSTRMSNAHTAFFVADEPLERGTTFRVEFEATNGGQPLRLVWSFHT